MSQTAENWSAIIENENNTNTVMESQASLITNMESMDDEDQPVSEVQQDASSHAESRADMEEGGGQIDGDKATIPASSTDSDTPLEPQNALEIQSLVLSAQCLEQESALESADNLEQKDLTESAENILVQQEGVTEAMEVNEPKQEQTELVNELENESFHDENKLFEAGQTQNVDQENIMGVATAESKSEQVGIKLESVVSEDQSEPEPEQEDANFEPGSEENADLDCLTTPMEQESKQDGTLHKGETSVDVCLSFDDEGRQLAEDIQSEKHLQDGSGNTSTFCDGKPGNVIESMAATEGELESTDVPKDHWAEGMETAEESVDRSEEKTDASERIVSEDIAGLSTSVSDRTAVLVKSEITQDLSASVDENLEEKAKHEESSATQGMDSVENQVSEKPVNESGKASDATIAEGEGEQDEIQSAEDLTAEDSNQDSGNAGQAVDNGIAAVGETGSADKDKTGETVDTTALLTPSGVELDLQAGRTAFDDDDDVVVLDDEEDSIHKVKTEISNEDVFNSNNDMGIQIASVSGGADELHMMAEQKQVKQENSVEETLPPTGASLEGDTQSKTSTSPAKKMAVKSQICIVCKRERKCKYNIVRNGDIRHLCDDSCFKLFRNNPSVFLKAVSASPAPNKDVNASPASSIQQRNRSKKIAPGTPMPPTSAKSTVPPGCKTCVVCLVLNLNNQGQFCMWKGLDFCSEACLGKFQSGISTTCSVCKSFIPLTARSTNCIRLGNEIRPFCGKGCYAEFKKTIKLCTFCQKDLSTAPSSVSAPVGSDGSFKDFCTHSCLKKFEEFLSIDVEVIRVEPGQSQGVNKCSVCQKSEKTKHAFKYCGVIINLCSDPCLSAFRYAYKLDTNICDCCGTLCSSLESSPHTLVIRGNKKSFCSGACVSKYRINKQEMIACSWCGSKRDNFDMIERLDTSNKYQLFCSLNCLSLFRVNLQAKSNQAVMCDYCMRTTPAQYHLTMSDASVRNFCSYNCVMTFQSQFTKGSPPPPPPFAPAPTLPPPKHKHNTRRKSSNKILIHCSSGIQQASVVAASPPVPVISNVVSLAPQSPQSPQPSQSPQASKTVTPKTSPVVSVVTSGTSPVATTTSSTSLLGSGQVQQKVIIQPPSPKLMKNKSLLCKPIMHTKATSCRPHSQNKECQTDEVEKKSTLIPVPVPVYMPTPMALYSSPTPTPVFIPIPIPVPVFIPTTRKSASGIMKQIKEIQESTPADPLEAEILMMAAAVSGDGKENDSSGSDTENETLSQTKRPRKRHAPTHDDGHANVMPLIKKEEGLEEDVISMALRMAEVVPEPVGDLESAVEAFPIKTGHPPQDQKWVSSEVSEDDQPRTRRATRRSTSCSETGIPPKRARLRPPREHHVVSHQVEPAKPPADTNYHLKFTYGVNAWRHWVMLKNADIERNRKRKSGRVKLFRTDILQCTADELNFSLCLFIKEVRKPSGEEYSPESIYYLTLGIQQYLYDSGRIDNIFSDYYYEKFADCLAELLLHCQQKYNSAGQMVCRIEEEHLWECKQLGAHSPYVLLNTLMYFNTKYFMLRTPEEHFKLSFAHILKYWRKGAQDPGHLQRIVSLRYYSVNTAKKDGSVQASTTRKGSKEGIPVYEVSENPENPLRCPVKLYEFYMSKCPESIRTRSDIFYPVPERSCVPDSPVWYSTAPLSKEVLSRMLSRILLVREIQEAHMHAQPIFV